MRSRVLTWCSALALCAGVAGAEERFALAIEGGYQGFEAAADSAKAVFDGSKGGLVLGGSLSAGWGPHWFVGLGGRTLSKDGQRVFVDNATVFRLGHPLRVRVTPLYAFVGYRLLPGRPLVPFVGVGGGVTRYREEATIGGLTESASASKASWRVLGGADYALGARLGVGFEASWSSAPNLVGLGGVSKFYGEDDLGGLAAVARLSYRFGGGQ